MRIFLGYLWDIFGISLGYLGDILGIFWGYLGDILGISLSERTSGVPPVIFGMGPFTASGALKGLGEQSPMNL